MRAFSFRSIFIYLIRFSEKILAEKKKCITLKHIFFLVHVSLNIYNLEARKKKRKQQFVGAVTDGH